MAAHAPRPGQVRKDEANRTGLEITLRGETRTLHLADLGPGDDLESRKQTGLPVAAFMGAETFGPDSLLILWWMARRKSGEPSLRFASVLEEFPSYDELASAEVNEVTDDGDDGSPEV